MAITSDLSRTLKILKTGPASGVTPPTEAEVRAVSKGDRQAYIGAVKALLRKMAESQLKNPEKPVVEDFAAFSAPWLDGLTDGVSRFYTGYLEAYKTAVSAGLRELNWQEPEQAPQIAAALTRNIPAYDTSEGLASRIVLGQVQSLFSRNDAAETFAGVREHQSASLVPSFYWDMGAFTYYSQNEVQNKRREIPGLSGMSQWSNDVAQQSDHAIVISMDESFFRTFAPMILFNAQQVPQVDFVLLLCVNAGTADQLVDDAQSYVESLSRLNRQSAPKNVRVHAVPKPEWVVNAKTYYAASRFLVLPELLQQYQTIYSMDADLFMMQNPQQFLRGSWPVGINAPQNKGLIGVIPWRRYMGGNVVVTQAAAGSSALQHLLDYLSVGLTEKFSWMLDQNALSYVADVSPAGEFGPLDRARPGSVARFMATWERNYRAAAR